MVVVSSFRTTSYSYSSLTLVVAVCLFSYLLLGAVDAGSYRFRSLLYGHSVVELLDVCFVLTMSVNGRHGPHMSFLDDFDWRAHSFIRTVYIYY